MIAGEYEGWKVVNSGGETSLMNFLSSVILSKNTVAKYSLLDKEDADSFGGTLLKGFVAHKIFGAAGLIATAAISHRKNYLLKIEFVNGKQSLLEIDQKNYKELLKNLQ